MRHSGVQAFGDIDKDLIKKYYQKELVGESHRKIIKVKRKNYE